MSLLICVPLNTTITQTTNWMTHSIKWWTNWVIWQFINRVDNDSTCPGYIYNLNNQKQWPFVLQLINCFIFVLVSIKLWCIVIECPTEDYLKKALLLSSHDNPAGLSDCACFEFNIIPHWLVYRINGTAIFLSINLLVMLCPAQVTGRQVEQSLPILTSQAYMYTAIPINFNYWITDDSYCQHLNKEPCNHVHVECTLVSTGPTCYSAAML